MGLPQAWNCHFPMARRPNAADPAGLRRRTASAAGLLRGVLPGATRGDEAGAEREISTSTFMTSLLLDRFSD
jgi:hypothetical protein